MRELSGAVVAMSIVLMAVSPRFLPGATGQIYKQFGLLPSRSLRFSPLSFFLSAPLRRNRRGGRGVFGFCRAINFFDRFN